METPASGLRQVLGESFAESLRTPPPPHTPRRAAFTVESGFRARPPPCSGS